MGFFVKKKTLLCVIHPQVFNVASAKDFIKKFSKTYSEAVLTEEEMKRASKLLENKTAWYQPLAERRTLEKRDSRSKTAPPPLVGPRPSQQDGDFASTHEQYRGSKSMDDFQDENDRFSRISSLQRRNLPSEFLGDVGSMKAEIVSIRKQLSDLNRKMDLIISHSVQSYATSKPKPLPKVIAPTRTQTSELTHKAPSMKRNGDML